MKIKIREYQPQDVEAMIAIWNEIVKEGNAFPQEEYLIKESGTDFFAAQSYCGVAEQEGSETLLGLYILHPNHIGRCGHISNASYAVSSKSRGNAYRRKAGERQHPTGKESGIWDFTV